MLYDLRITARGGGGARELQGRLGRDVGGGVFQTEVGTAGQTVVIWPRETAPAGGGGGRGEGRGGGEGNERLAVPPFGKHELEILKLAPFMKPLEPQEIGRVWELRWFDYAPGGAQEALPAFEKALPHRNEYYPVVGCWTEEVGPHPDRIYLLMPYKDWDHRDEVRAALRNDSQWPPETAALSGGARLLLPAGFSPLH